MTKLQVGLFGYILLTLLSANNFQAQTPQSIKAWSGSFGAGLAATSGNSDTRNVNVSLNIVRDTKERVVTRANAIYLRGEKDGSLILNRTTMTGREEYAFPPRVFLFTQMDYIRDKFKDIDYILSPTIGIGVNLVKRERTTLAIDTGIGGVWERDVDQPTRASGAYNTAERFSWKILPGTVFTQSIASLFKTNDFSDSLHNMSAGLGVSITSHLELKLEFLDSYKNKTPLTTLRKNDTSTVTALVVKF
jgi:putative salt-induced outer membrane protein YdiY